MTVIVDADQDKVEAVLAPGQDPRFAGQLEPGNLAVCQHLAPAWPPRQRTGFTPTLFAFAFPLHDPHPTVTWVVSIVGRTPVSLPQ